MVSKEYKEYVRDRLISLETNRRTKLTEEFKKKFSSEIKEIEQLVKEINYKYNSFHKIEKDFEHKVEELAKKAPKEVNVYHAGWVGHDNLAFMVNHNNVYSKNLEPVLTILLENLSAKKGKKPAVVNLEAEVKKFQDTLEKAFNEISEKEVMEKTVLS